MGRARGRRGRGLALPRPYEAAPDAADAAEIRAKAGEQLARAGERAASLGASEEGERYFAQAAEPADDPLRKAELAEQAGRMAWLGGRDERGRALLEEAHDVFEAHGLRTRRRSYRPCSERSTFARDIHLEPSHGSR